MWCNMTIRYVSINGNNNNDGLTENTAWRNTSYAGQYAISGDIIRILPGTYLNDDLHIYNSGTSTNRIIFEGYDPSGQNIKPIISGGYPGSSGVCIANIPQGAANRKGYITIKNLIIQNFSYCLQAHGDNWIVQNLILRNAYMGLTPYCINSLFEDCIAYDIDWVGHKFGSVIQPDMNIQADDASHNSIIRKLEAYRCTHNGIDMKAASYLTFEDCYVHDNPGNGLYITNCSHHITVMRCRAENNGEHGIKVQGAAYCDIRECISIGHNVTSTRCGFMTTFDPSVDSIIGYHWVSKNNTFIDCYAENNGKNYYVWNDDGHKFIRCTSLNPLNKDFDIESSTYKVTNLLIQDLPNKSYLIRLLNSASQGRILSTTKQDMTTTGSTFPIAVCDTTSCYIDFNQIGSITLNLSGGTCPNPICNITIANIYE